MNRIKEHPITLAVVFGVISGSLSGFFNLLIPGVVFGLMFVLCFYVLFSEVKMPFAKKQSNSFHFGKAFLFVLGSTLSFIAAVHVSSGYIRSPFALDLGPAGYLSTEIMMIIAGAIGALLVYGLYCWLFSDRGRDALLFGFFIPLIGAIPSLIFYIPNFSTASYEITHTLLVLFIIWQTLMMTTLVWRYKHSIQPSISEEV